MTELERLEITDIQEQLFSIRDRLAQLEGQIDLSIKGFIVPKMIRCGKESCRCAGGDLHGPYPHLQYIGEDKRLHQKYLNRKIYPEYKKKVAANQEYRKLKIIERKLVAALHKKGVSTE